MPSLPPSLQLSASDSLPPSSSLAIGKLAGIFRHVTNSYKFLMFRSLLNRVRVKRSSRRIGYEELAVGMLADSWTLLHRLRLNFGKRDHMVQYIERLRLDDSTERMNSPIQVSRVVARSPQLIPVAAELMHYVPSRLIRPWFESYPEVKGQPDGVINKAVARLAYSKFDKVKPLYRIVKEGADCALELHEQWEEYFLNNAGILEGWLDRRWIDFLQARNPHVPMLSEKLWGMAKRKSLARQRLFWEAAIAGDIHCIYTSQPVSPEDFVLDHFVPRIWAGHDQLWNLIPTSSRINSAKSDGIPSPCLVADLADLHHQAIMAAQRSSSGWKIKVEDYVAGLNLQPEELLDSAKLREAYSHTVKPQLDLAVANGFPAWHAQAVS